MIKSIVTGKFTSYTIRIGIVLVVVLLTLLSTIKSETAFAYSCSSPHCYGVNSWSRSTEFFGSYTDISMVHLSCNTACASNGFIDDEMWLIDMTSCTSQAYRMCWIETGYIDYYSSNETFFWADKPPVAPFSFGLTANVPAGDYGNNDHFMIIKDGRTTPNPFLLFMYNASRSTFFEPP